MAVDDPFVRRVKEVLVPEIRLQGFRGKFPTFRRIRGQLIQQINIQGWRYGGERTVNLGIGFKFLQPVCASVTAPETEYDYRIGTLDGRDRWWTYGNATQAEAYALADHMITTFRAEAPQ